MSARLPRLTALGVAVCVALAACGASTSSGGSSSSTSTGVSGTVTVFAAASLQESFTALGATFEKAHPGTKVTFSFGPSSGLATSIVNGAPADVFASASTKNMDAVVSAGAASGPTTFAQNTMEIAVPPANPGRVSSLADLSRPGTKVALCQAQVPCGATAAKVFANAKLTVRPVTEEVDVKSVLSKVQLGEVDAGVVYVTDVQAAGAKVRGVEIPGDVNATTAYPLAVLSKALNPAAAKAFTDLVLSAEGTKVLQQAGFSAP